MKAFIHLSMSGMRSSDSLVSDHSFFEYFSIKISYYLVVVVAELSELHAIKCEEYDGEVIK